MDKFEKQYLKRLIDFCKDSIEEQDYVIKYYQDKKNNDMVKYHKDIKNYFINKKNGHEKEIEDDNFKGYY